VTRMRSNKPLVPTRNGEAPLLAAQRRREIAMQEEVLEALAASGLREASAAAQLVRNGARLDVHDEASCDGMMATYRVRLRCVRRMSSEHARSLAEATSEFVSNLERHRPAMGQWLIIKGSGEVHYLIFRVDGDGLLACLPVVSQLRVSSERWDELWSGDA
jgi:hypothetical protein